MWTRVAAVMSTPHTITSQNAHRAAIGSDMPPLHDRSSSTAPVFLALSVFVAFAGAACGPQGQPDESTTVPSASEPGSGGDGSDRPGATTPDAGGTSPGGGTSSGGMPSTAGGSSAGGASSGAVITETRTLCSDTCFNAEYVKDGKCYDGGPDADFNACRFGTDCSDCGPRVYEAPVVTGAGKAACTDMPYGVHEGDYAEDWTTYNQYGAAVSLSDFCGKWVYIEFGYMGCGACNLHAPMLELAAKNLKDYKEGLVVIDALGENLNPIPPNDTVTPSVAELAGWADKHGQAQVHAVCEADFAIHARYWPFGPDLEHKTAPDWGHPEAMLIRPSGVIEYKSQMRENGIKAAMDGLTYPTTEDREK